MNRTETRRSKQRQTSRPSNLLNETENAFIHQNLQNRQIAQATAVVELLEEHDRRWRRIGTGALCFIKDSHRRSYFINFFHIQQEKHRPVWEQEIYESINAINQRPFFIQFSANERQMGLNFADQSEAREVFNLIQEKSKPKTQKQSGLTVKPLQTQNRMTNQHPVRGNDAIIASQEPPPKQESRATKKVGIDKSMISAPSDFRHIAGGKINNKGKFEQVQADLGKDDDVKKLLMDMNLIQNVNEFDKILQNEKARSQIYGYIDSVGGINRARQSIRHPTNQPRVPGYVGHVMPPPPPPVNEHRTIHNLPRDHTSRDQNQPPKPPNRRESIRETQKPNLNNRPPPPPPPGGKRPNMPPPPPKPGISNRPPPPPGGPPAPLGGPPGPPPPAPPGPPPPNLGAPTVGLPIPPSSGSFPPPPPKQVQRNPERDSRNDLFNQINSGGFKLKHVDHSQEHAQMKPQEESGDIQATLAAMLKDINKAMHSDEEEDDDDEWSD